MARTPYEIAVARQTFREESDKLISAAEDLGHAFKMLNYTMRAFGAVALKHMRDKSDAQKAGPDCPAGLMERDDGMRIRRDGDRRPV